MGIKLWLDDVRPAPEGWTLALSAIEAAAILDREDVDEASLDHDLGDACDRCWDNSDPEIVRRADGCDGNCGCYCHLDGSWLVRWMAENDCWPRTKPRVHSANPVGASYMRGVIDRYGPYDK